MKTLAGRFYDLKTRIGGNREKQDFEYSFGMPEETVRRVTLPAPHIRRILGETGFALQLSCAEKGVHDTAIGAALEILEKCLDTQGTITKDSAAGAENALLPVQEAARAYTILCASHAHIDMNWMWSWQETVAAALATFRTMLTLMEEYPAFTFSQSQASVYHLVEKYDPEMMDEIKKRIQEGRWEVTASAWVETDKNMPCTESLLRHIRYTRDYLEKTWGVDPASLNIDFSPDTFGHSAHIPEIDGYGGVQYFYHCRGLEDRQVLYHWKAPSGKELLAYCEPYWYNSGITAEIAAGLPELASKSGGLKTGLIVYGVGDHGGGPTRRDIEAIIEMQNWPVFPALRFGRFSDFFKAAEKVRGNLPVIDREINYFATGCYTTQSRIKMGNRHGEAALLDAESLDALGGLFTGKHYPSQKLIQAWQGVLFTHFHDILTGSCVRDSREHAMSLFSEAQAAAGTARNKQARSLASLIDTSMIVMDKEDSAEGLGSYGSQSEGAGAGYGIEGFQGVPNPERGAGKVRIYHVFNPAPRTRRELVEFTVWDWPWDLHRAKATDYTGKDIPFQLVDKELQRYWDHRYIRFLAEVEVPAMGYTTVVFREAEMSEAYPHYYCPFPRSDRAHNPMVLENEYITARFDGETGALFSLVDKSNGAEKIACGEKAGLVLTWSEKASNSAWQIGRRLGHEAVTKTTRLIPHTGNSLRNGFELEQEILGSKIKTRIALDKGAKALSYHFDITWNETADAHDNVPVLAFYLPLKEKAEACMNDIPGGTIKRQESGQDIPGLQFAAAVKGGGALALITDCKYGYRFYDGILSATLINTARSPDPDPERGQHLINLWIAAEKNDPKILTETAGNYNHALTVISGGAKSRSGSLPPEMEFLKLEAGSTLFSSAGLARDGALLVRLNETAGSKDKVTLKLPKEVKEACFVDLEEKALGSLNPKGKELAFEMAPYTVQGIKIRMM
jgi:alpha-mannosidase